MALNGKPWSDPSVTSLRIADFACGTGSLLDGAYNEIRRRLEISGVSARKLHPAFVENSLIGSDVMPSATYITASILSSAFPAERYKHTNTLTLPYGRQPDGSVSLGAIELLSTQGALSIIDTGAAGLGAKGEVSADPWVVVGGTGIADASFDLVIMNPPFTRLTGGGGKTSEIPLPMFAAFGTEQEEQELMSARTKQLTFGTCAYGNAGEASIFVQVAHKQGAAWWVSRISPPAYILVRGCMGGLPRTDPKELHGYRYCHHRKFKIWHVRLFGRYKCWRMPVGCAAS